MYVYRLIDCVLLKVLIVMKKTGLVGMNFKVLKPWETYPIHYLKTTHLHFQKNRPVLPKQRKLKTKYGDCLNIVQTKMRP